MNQFAFRKEQSNLDLNCAALMTMAEQELAAFFRAVKELFGTEQAKLSADDWLRELAKVDLPSTSIREWRLITIEASRKLAARLNTPSASFALTISA